RAPFAASFSCQRENAHSDCIPLLPLRIDFNAPISAADANRIRLKTGSAELSPKPEATGPYRDSVERVQFDGPFTEKSEVTVLLPQDLKDDSGRSLSNGDQFPLVIGMGPYPP